MRLYNVLLRGFYLAPNGSAADAGDSSEDGEITDEEALAAEKGTETTEEVDETEPEVEAEPEVVSYKDYFAKAGLQGVPDDPAQFAVQWQAAQRAQQEAAQLRQWMQWQQLQAQQKPPEPKQEAPRKKLWEIPQFDPALKQGLMLDENGAVVVKPGYDPSLPQQYQKYQAAVEQAQLQSLQMLSDPQAFFEQHLQPAVMPIIQQQAAAIAQQQMAEYQERAEIQRFEQENRGWVFAADGVTLTPAAQLWNQHYGYAKQIGFPNAVAYASKMLDAELFSQYAAQQAQEPVETDADKKLGFLKTAAKRSANKGGSMRDRNKKGPPQNGSDHWAELREKIEALPKADFDE